MATSPIVWARCARPEHVPIMQDLADRLAEDGDDIAIKTTLTDHPTTRRDIRDFLTQNAPIQILWIGGPLDPVVLQIAISKGIPVTLIDADDTTVKSLSPRWFKTRGRVQLAAIDAIFAQDNAVADALIRLGAPQQKTIVTGPVETSATILPVDDDARVDMSAHLQNRPLWMVRSAAVSDVSDLSDAHRHAARRSHRLLLTVVPHDPAEAAEMATAFRDKGFATLQASIHDSGPEEATQVYIADTADQAGLWLRLAPICVAGGSFAGQGAIDDPFEATALGAVVAHGPNFGQYPARFRRLVRAGASMPVTDPSKLGGAVEILLAPDRVARMSVSGWEVTSSGAELTNRLIELIQNSLDRASG